MSQKSHMSTQHSGTTTTGGRMCCCLVSYDRSHTSHMSTQKSHISTQKSHMSTQKSNMSTQKSHMSTQKSHMSTQKSHMSTQKSHMSTQKSHMSTQHSRTTQSWDIPQTLQHHNIHSGTPQGQHRVGTYHKPYNTIISTVEHPKDNTEWGNTTNPTTPQYPQWNTPSTTQSWDIPETLQHHNIRSGTPQGQHIV